VSLRSISWFPMNDTFNDCSNTGDSHNRRTADSRRRVRSLTRGGADESRNVSINRNRVSRDSTNEALSGATGEVPRDRRRSNKLEPSKSEDPTVNRQRSTERSGCSPTTNKTTAAAQPRTRGEESTRPSRTLRESRTATRVRRTEGGENNKQPQATTTTGAIQSGYNPNTSGWIVRSHATQPQPILTHIRCGRVVSSSTNKAAHLSTDGRPPRHKHHHIERTPTTQTVPPRSTHAREKLQNVPTS
jgi:hypothetical protein